MDETKIESYYKYLIEQNSKCVSDRIKKTLWGRMTEYEKLLELESNRFIVGQCRENELRHLENSRNLQKLKRF